MVEKLSQRLPNFGAMPADRQFIEHLQHRIHKRKRPTDTKTEVNSICKDYSNKKS
ncbi:hypothetical protein DICVIV_14090 [Dictyocaulus viviparus]|uniref:Uncharacterized protein n=1 Tax=Dictyocaulus viviparus TaxID=29172 RepID=A0A0D8X668_DICVI|nr:hypothetical protein DICVIV_14090 [Dictyocaulus viviparus]